MPRITTQYINSRQSKKNDDIEMMTNIAYLIQKGNMGYNEVINLPYSIFLSLLKQFQLTELMKDPEYRKLIEQEEILQQKEPDWDRLSEYIEKK